MTIAALLLLIACLTAAVIQPRLAARSAARAKALRDQRIRELEWELGLGKGIMQPVGKALPYPITPIRYGHRMAGTICYEQSPFRSPNGNGVNRGGGTL